MEYSNTITLRIWGRYALFSDPVTRVGGEKHSYPVPTLCSVQRPRNACRRREAQLSGSDLPGGEGNSGKRVLETYIHLGAGRNPCHESHRDRIQGHPAYPV